jgi:hypothetical protein
LIVVPHPSPLRGGTLPARGRAIAFENVPRYPSPAERVGRVAVAKRRSGGGAPVIENAEMLRPFFENPHPGSLSLADPPHKGEG